MQLFRSYKLIPFIRKISLKGIFPPIATTFKPNEDVDIDSLKFNLTKYSSINFGGLVVFGTNGEHVMLNLEERINLLKIIRSSYKNTLLVGVRNESTRETINEAQIISKAGADALLIGPPIIFRNSISEKCLIEHYTKIADNVDIPVVVYNMPGAFVTDMSAELVIKTSEHKNIVGFKDSGGDVMKLWRIADGTKNNNFHVLAGSAGFLLPSMIGGCDGGICALANIIGNEVVHLYQLIRDNKISEAIELQNRMIRPNAYITKKYGVPGMKYAMDLFGLNGGECRAPNGILTEHDKTDIEAVFREYRFLN